MEDDEGKDKLVEAAGMGCVGGYLIIQIGIPILLFILLCMAVFKGCVRMFS